jgi:hypothetical protein
VLIIFSITFYKERVVFTDAAHYMLYLTKTGTIYTQHYRYGAVLLQLLPLLGIHAGLSLDKIILLYSISFSLYYFSCYALCGFVFKDYKMAIVLLLFNILFATHTFYYMISELPLGIAMLLVLFAYLRNREKLSVLSIIVSAILLVTAVFLHPMTLFVIVFSLVFFYLSYPDIISKTKIYFLSGLYITIYIVKKYYFTGPYDAHGAEALNNFKTLYPHYVHLYSNKNFLKNCIDRYYWLPTISIIILIVYLAKRQWLKLMLFGVFMVGFLLMVNVSFPTDYTTDFYIENLYLPMGLFVALPFVFDVIPILQEKRLSVAAIFLISVTACVRIYANSKPYVNRLNWERSFLDKHLNEKLLMQQTKAQLDTLLMTWGTPYEFWMISTTEYHQTASIIIGEDIGYLTWATKEKNKFVVAWDSFAYNALPSKYFIFKDSVSTYKLIK